MITWHTRPTQRANRRQLKETANMADRPGPQGLCLGIYVPRLLEMVCDVANNTPALGNKSLRLIQTLGDWHMFRSRNILTLRTTLSGGHSD